MKLLCLALISLTAMLAGCGPRPEEQRAAAAQAAADKRNQDAIQAAKDRAAQNAWDKRTDQGAYSSSASPSPFGTNPADKIRNQILQDQQKIEGAD